MCRVVYRDTYGLWYAGDWGSADPEVMYSRAKRQEMFAPGYRFMVQVID